ncbi:MAG: hypothetical protein HY043_02125, partial [Verrucomicrobia bacterium]|nr:hypothetical protein [Verrucomicrobiota bacterium]
DGFHLWSDTFDRKAEDVFAIQTEVAQRVQEVLKVKLLAGGSPDATLAGTENLEAYDLYLRGREFWNKRTGANIERAVGLFQQATEKDPKFALAYAGLAACYAILPNYAYVRGRDAASKARAAAFHALQLESNLAEAHAVLGFVKSRFDWDRGGAEKAYQKAISLNPNYATARHWYGALMGWEGRFEESMAELRQAQALDPLSAVIRVVSGQMYYFQRKFEQSLTEIGKALEIAPDFSAAHHLRGKVYLAQRKAPEAIRDLEKFRALVGTAPGLGDLGHVYAIVGRTDDARQVLRQLSDALEQGTSVSFDIAFVHLGLGDKEQTFSWLERVAEAREQDLRTLKIDPLWADLIKDPRYAALLKKFDLDK